MPCFLPSTDGPSNSHLATCLAGPRHLQPRLRVSTVRLTAHIRLVTAVPALTFLVWFLSAALGTSPRVGHLSVTQMRSWAVNEDPCDHPLLTHRRFGLTGPPVHVDFNNPGRLGNRLFQAALATSDPNPNPNPNPNPQLFLGVDILGDTYPIPIPNLTRRLPPLWFSPTAPARPLASRDRSQTTWPTSLVRKRVRAARTWCSVRATCRRRTGPTTRTCPFGVLAGRTLSSVAAA